MWSLLWPLFLWTTGLNWICVWRNIYCLMSVFPVITGCVYDLMYHELHAQCLNNLQPSVWGILFILNDSVAHMFYLQLPSVTWKTSSAQNWDVCLQANKQIHKYGQYVFQKWAYNDLLWFKWRILIIISTKQTLLLIIQESVCLLMNALRYSHHVLCEIWVIYWKSDHDSSTSSLYHRGQWSCVKTWRCRS